MHMDRTKWRYSVATASTGDAAGYPEAKGDRGLLGTDYVKRKRRKARSRVGVAFSRF